MPTGDPYFDRLHGNKAKTTPKTNGSPPAEPLPRARRDGSLPNDYPAVYDQAKKLFWDKNTHGEWMSYGETQFNRKLIYRGVPKTPDKDTGMNLVQLAMTEIMEEKSVHYAGELAGYPTGIYQISGNRVLVTRGPVIPKPNKQPFNTLDTFLNSLLSDERRYFDAWIKSALLALKAGSPFRPGQVLGIAGPPGCGKSLLQDIITEILGGRSAKPYRYLTGDTSFNSDLFRAEHLCIEDEPASVDARTRRHFAAAIKGLCVNRTQSFHPKGKDSMPLTPFWRVSISVNDDQDHLMVLPPLDDSLLDKIILLRAKQARFPFTADDLDGRKHFRQRLTDELPGYLHWLKTWRMPSSLQDQRFGCIAYQNEDLKRMLSDLEPENKLWEHLHVLDVVPRGHVGWRGTAAQLEHLVKNKISPDDARRLFYFNTACGVMLSKLAKLYPENVRKTGVGGHKAKWHIVLPEDDEF